LKQNYLATKKPAQKRKPNCVTLNKIFKKNIKKQEEQEAILGKRNSYSKTNPGATFMRMEDDHMLNR